MAVAVSNYGIIIVDLHNKAYVSGISLRELDRYYPEYFDIYYIFEVDKNSLRLLIDKLGSVSIGWTRIEPQFNEVVFKGLKISNLVLNTKDQIYTNLISLSSTGYVHLVYYQYDDNFKDAYFRVYNLYNKEKSKVLTEVNIGIVQSCSSIVSKAIDLNTKIRVILICDSIIHMYIIHLYPYMTLTKLHDSFVKFEISSKNDNSEQTVVVHANYEFEK